MIIKLLCDYLVLLEILHNFSLLVKENFTSLSSSTKFSSKRSSDNCATFTSTSDAWREEMLDWRVDRNALNGPVSSF